MFVYLHHLVSGHPCLNIKIKHDGHITIRVMNNTVNLEFFWIVIDGGIFFQRKDGLSNRMNGASTYFRIFYSKLYCVFSFFAFFCGKPEKQIEVIPDTGIGTIS